LKLQIVNEGEKGKNFSRNNTGKRKESDLYETPYSMTRQLFQVEWFEKGKKILEPACGDMAIVHVMTNLGYKSVGYSDLRDGGDFLALDPGYEFDYIITNPPYSKSLEFIEKAKTIATGKIAFLLPITYLQGQERFDKVYQDKNFPLARVHVFIRYPMLGDVLRGDGKYRTGMQTYAWFVWDKSHQGPPQIGWIDNREYVLKKGD
jgi:hypothetical protein